MSAAVAAIEFALATECPMDFLRFWNEGDFDAIRQGWPEAPEDIYIGADPLYSQTPTPAPEQVEDDKRDAPAEPEMVNCFGVNSTGEHFVGLVPMPDRMKAKELIRNYIGDNFADEDSPESYAMYIVEDLLKWQQEQRAAIAAAAATKGDA